VQTLLKQLMISDAQAVRSSALSPALFRHCSGSVLFLCAEASYLFHYVKMAHSLGVPQSVFVSSSAAQAPFAPSSALAPHVRACYPPVLQSYLSSLYTAVLLPPSPAPAQPAAAHNERAASMFVRFVHALCAHTTSITARFVEHTSKARPPASAPPSVRSGHQHVCVSIGFCLSY
jgi:hypothetical protein